MSAHIRELVHQIHELEEELRDALHEQETRPLFQLDGGRVRFKTAVRAAHLRARMGLPAWLRSSEFRNGLSAPFIYAMLAPMLVYDLFLTVYQAVCFRLYRVPRVRRSDYIVMDRFDLGYLNIIERFNCVYCGYANGLIAYAREITSRTELYWCPIKHARKVVGSHRRYADFLDFGDAHDYYARLEALRQRLRDDPEPVRRETLP